MITGLNDPKTKALPKKVTFTITIQRLASVASPLPMRIDEMLDCVTMMHDVID